MGDTWDGNKVSTVSRDFPSSAVHIRVFIIG